MKALTEYTDRELLKKFASDFDRYDSLRDTEFDFLSDHPNRDIWDEEQENEYKELLGEIASAYNEVVKTLNFINNLT